MPELPDVELYVALLRERIAGRPLEAVRLKSPIGVPFREFDIESQPFMVGDFWIGFQIPSPRPAGTTSKRGSSSSSGAALVPAV